MKRGTNEACAVDGSGGGVRYRHCGRHSCLAVADVDRAKRRSAVGVEDRLEESSRVGGWE